MVQGRFWTAIVLFEQDIEDEGIVIPTLAFAKYATGIPEYDDLVRTQGAAEKPTPADLARILLAAGNLSSSMTERGYQGWELAKVVEGVPFVRALPFSVFAEDHQGTPVLKQVRIQVLSKHAEIKTIGERYEEALTGRGVQWDDSASGCISHNFLGGYLDLRVRPTDCLIYKDAGNSLDQELIERYKDFFLRRAYPGAYPSEQPDDHPYPYPSPRYIEASCKGLLGLRRSKKPVGVAHALDLYGQPNKKTADKVIPALVAWHLGAHVVPTVGRRRIARMLNKHLLGPCEKDQLPEDSWRNDDALVWRDARVLSERVERLYRAGLEKPLNKPRGSR